MAIAFRASGSSGSGGTTSCTADYPAGIQPGDMLVLAVVNKYPSNGPTTPDDWSLAGQYTGGSGSAAADAGSVYVTVYLKEATGAETGTLNVSVPSGNSCRARMTAYSKSGSKGWGTAIAGGSDNTAGTAWAATASSDPGVTAGDMLLAITGHNTDAPTWTLEAMTQTGVTFGTMAERFDATTGQGQDCGLLITEHPVSSGTGSVPPSYAATASTSGTDSPCGATAFLRLREVDVTGSAGGTSSTSGVGGSTASSTGTATAVATATGEASSTASTTGSAAGAATAAGEASSTASATGAATCAATCAGEGETEADCTGAAAGTSTAAGSASSTASTTGAAAGAATASATASAAPEATGSAAGSATCSAEASAVAEAVGLAAGFATVWGFPPIGELAAGDAEVEGRLLVEDIVIAGRLAAGAASARGRLVSADIEVSAT